MYDFFQIDNKLLMDWFVPVGLILVSFVIGYIIKKFLFKSFHKLTQKTKSGVDDIIVGAIERKFVFYVFLVFCFIAVDISVIPNDIKIIISKIIISLGVISVVLLMIELTKRILDEISDNENVATNSIIETILKVVIIALAVLVILNVFNISITPFLATLGVGGLAIALALKDTLSNFFAGFYLITARQLKVGDYIELDTGKEGYITDINWRTTEIRMLPNNMVLIPNSKLIQSIIINYNLPYREMSVLVQVGVHYDNDLEFVEKVTCEVAKEVMNEIKGGVSSFDPFIRYHTFGNSSIDFTVILKTKEFVEKYIIKHEFIKRLHKRYKEEGIVIPFPIMALNYEQEKVIKN